MIDHTGEDVPYTSYWLFRDSSPNIDLEDDFYLLLGGEMNKDYDYDPIKLALPADKNPEPLKLSPFRSTSCYRGVWPELLKLSHSSGLPAIEWRKGRGRGHKSRSRLGK